MSYTLPLTKVGRDDTLLVGGKAANLGEMINAGFPVPPGFVITSEAFFNFLEATNLAQKIPALLTHLNFNSQPALEEASKLIERSITSSKLPPELEKEITVAYKKLSRGKSLQVAVRSSSTGEDLDQATAAGQASTLLNISGAKNLAPSLKKIWASLFTPRALFYRHQTKRSLVGGGIAVVIQEMVEPDVSGVAFSIDPITNDKSKITVEAIYGLGELIVQGVVNPDHFEFDKKSLEVIFQQIGFQDKQLIKAGSQNKLTPISQAYGATQKLPTKLLSQVAAYTKQLENHYQKPQDVEWAWNGKKLYLVQTRPITTGYNKVEKPVAIGLPIVVTGAPGSPGVRFGKAVVIHSAHDLDKVRKGDILVTEYLSPDFVPAMKRAAAIVTDKGGRTAHAAIISRELGVPAVVGTIVATKTLQDGLTYTVNGTTGLVHQGHLGSSRTTLPYSPKPEVVELSDRKTKTATKIMVSISDPEAATLHGLELADGVGVLSPEFMIKQIGIHPGFAIKNGLAKTYTSKLVDGIVKVAEAFAGKPVIYRLSDFTQTQLQGLKGGESEAVPLNPILGCHGACRHINNPDELALELDALKKARNISGHKNLHLLIPFVRSSKELASIKQLIGAASLHRSTTFQLFMSLETPANILELEDISAMGIDGVIVNLHRLSELTNGVDHNSDSHDNKASVSEAVLWMLQRAGTDAKRLGLKVGVIGSNLLPISENLVRSGYNFVIVMPDQLDDIRSEVGQAEQRLVAKNLK